MTFLWAVSCVWLNLAIKNEIDIRLGIGIWAPIIGCGTLFLIDALPLTYQIKNVISGVAAFLVLWGMIESYFMYQEVLYNPFKSLGDLSKISIKSIHLGFCIELFVESKVWQSKQQIPAKIPR